MNARILGGLLLLAGVTRAAESSRAEQEAALLAQLRGDPPAAARQAIIEPLSLVASNAAIPVLAPWLGDPQRSHAARYVLYRLGTPEAVAALRAALPKVDGKLKAGLIGTLADLHDAASVAPIAEALNDADTEVSGAACRALGRLGGPLAAARLRAAHVPEALAALRDDALAACAEQFIAAGAKGEAEAIGLDLAGAARPAASRVLGLRVLVAAGSGQASALLEAALRDPDRTLAVNAARLLAGVPGADVVARLSGLWDALAPPLQAVVMAALGERGDVAAGPLALRALASPDATVRGAALHALGAVGDAAAVAPLADIATSGRADERGAAREALARLRGAGVDEALGKLIPGPSAAAAAAALGDRRYAAAATLLLAAAAGTDTKAAAEACRALAKLAGPDAVTPLVKVLCAAADEDVREAARAAVTALIKPQADPAAALAPVLAALPTSAGEARRALLGVLAELGGDVALAELTKAVTAPEPEVRRFAVQALAETLDDPRALPTLLTIARGPEAALQPAARQGWLRLLGHQAAARPAETVAALADGRDLWTGTAERRLVLSVLRQCRVPQAVQWAGELVSHVDVQAEAEATVRYLTGPQRDGNQTLPAVTGPEADAALEAVQAARGIHLPAGWRLLDLGETNPKGLARGADGAFDLECSGADLWGTADSGLLVARPAKGDVTVTARVASIKETDPWAKAGVVIRADATPGAACAFSGCSAHNGALMQWRATASGETQYQPAPGDAPQWVRLTRHGDQFVAELSADGKAWIKIGEQTVKLPAEVLVGLAASAHNVGAVTRAVFESVVVAAE
jgi:HEAT repeat protein/regulation of enolase protein 1 (concanavalin A-like superfamily)